VNEPTTQKGYGVRSRIADQQPQFYSHHLPLMFKFRCDITFTGLTAVTKTPTSVQALSNEMQLVTRCGRNYQQGERNQKVTYKPTIFKLLTPCILINFFPSTKPTKCTYNMHNSTVHSKCAPWMNTLCSASIRGAHSGYQNNGLSGSVQHTDVSIRNIIFSCFLNQLKQNFITVFLLHYIIHGGHAVWQLVAALRYKPERRGFDSPWWHWISHRLYPSGRTMALGSTQPITETRTMPVSWGVKGAGRQYWRSYYLEVSNVQKSGSLNLLEPYGSVRGLYSDCFTLIQGVPKLVIQLSEVITSEL
jgi:hypothetical protein